MTRNDIEVEDLNAHYTFMAYHNNYVGTENDAFSVC
jgi:hypothetical protein